MRTNCIPHTQPERGVVIIAPPTVRYSEQILYAAILATVSVIRNSEVVHYSGVSIVLYVYMETAVGACNSVRYSVDVRYWECLLIESPLYQETLTK